MKKEVMSFRTDVAPGETLKLMERIKDNGMIVEVRARFYPGPEGALRVNPYVLHTAQRQENLLTFAGETQPYIYGDDDYFIFPVRVPVELDDDMVVWAQNTDVNYPYTLAVDVVISYDMEVGPRGAAAV